MAGPISNVFNYAIDLDRNTCLVLAKTAEKALLASINLADGKLEWQTEPKGDPIDLDLGQTVAPFMYGDSVYLELGGLSRIDRETGEVRWHASYDTTVSKQIPLQRPNPNPAIYDGDIITAAAGCVRRVDLESGAIKWASDTPSLVPAVLPRSGSIVALTGGIYQRWLVKVSWRDVILPMASAVAMGASTGGRLVVPTPGVIMMPGSMPPYITYDTSSRSILQQANTWEAQKEIEGVDAQTLFSLSYAGNPGVITLDPSDGKILFEHISEGETAGLVAKGDVTLVADRENIRLVDLGEGKSSPLFSLADHKDLGKKIEHLISRNTGECLVITSKPASAGKRFFWSAAAPRHYVARVSLATGKVLWSVDLGIKCAGMMPLFYNQDERILFVYAVESVGTSWGMLCLDAQQGRLLWNQRISDKGWSVYPGDGLVVYYDKKRKRLVRSVEGIF